MELTQTIRLPSDDIPLFGGHVLLFNKKCLVFRGHYKCLHAIHFAFQANFKLFCFCSFPKLKRATKKSFCFGLNVNLNDLAKMRRFFGDEIMVSWSPRKIKSLLHQF